MDTYLLKVMIRDCISSKGLKIFGIAVGAIVLLIVLLCMGDSRQRTFPGVLKELGLGTITKTDEHGTVWTLDLASLQSLDAIRNSPNQPGEPLTVHANVRPVNPSEKSIAIIIEGQAGENYSPVILKTGKRARKPEFKVVTRRGTVIGSGEFEYG